MKLRWACSRPRNLTAKMNRSQNSVALLCSVWPHNMAVMYGLDWKEPLPHWSSGRPWLQPGPWIQVWVEPFWHAQGQVVNSLYLERTRNMWLESSNCNQYWIAINYWENTVLQTHTFIAAYLDSVSCLVECSLKETQMQTTWLHSVEGASWNSGKSSDNINELFSEADTWKLLCELFTLLWL